MCVVLAQSDRTKRIGIGFSFIGCCARYGSSCVAEDTETAL